VTRRQRRAPAVELIPGPGTRMLPAGHVPAPAAPTRHPRKVAAAIERVIASAQAHGEQSDPEHEAGDLGAFLRIFAKHAPAAAIEAAVREFFGTHDDWTEV
jgi:hypothetical protein